MSAGFDRALDRFAQQPDDVAMAAVAMFAPDADVGQLARLTTLLAGSGDHLASPMPDVVDIASSGGPGSLSTLLAPLYACALGARVAKIAVPGRPAGGLDVLGCLPGFDPDLDGAAARAVFDACGYVHVAAGSAFCPLDSHFFAWRQAHGAQAVPNLAITSLLAKKLAAGVSRVVFDIRVGTYGNFGATAEEARSHANRLVAVAADLGIGAICVLTSSLGVAQPWIGRGEALVALAQIFAGQPDDALRAHANDCLQMARLVTNSSGPPEADALTEPARAAHESMLTAHGASPQGFWSRQQEIAAAQRHSVVASNAGSLRVDLDGIRRVLVERQHASMPRAGTRFPDPGGVKLALEEGAAVERGTVLARVRDDDDPMHLSRQIAPYFSILDGTRVARTHTPMEIIRG